MKKNVWIISLFIASFHVSACAQGMDQGLKYACNEAMLSIYEDVVKRKSEYPFLSGFDREALSLNQHGIYAIKYHPARGPGFGVTIVETEDTNFGDAAGEVFNLTFPLIGVKFAGYQLSPVQAYPYGTQSHPKPFNIQSVIQKHGQMMLDRQQSLLPFRLDLKASKDRFSVGEPVKFSATLTNTSKNALRVRELNEKTLYFVYLDARWGAKEVDPARTKTVKEVVLNPQESIHRSFEGTGFPEPREIEIFGSYAQTYQGVNPSSVLKVIVE